MLRDNARVSDMFMEWTNSVVTDTFSKGKLHKITLQSMTSVMSEVILKSRRHWSGAMMVGS